MRYLTTIVGLVGTLALSGCETASPRREVAAARTIRKYGCQSCHTIPGIAGANATVGPPLDQFGDRTYISGTLPNSPNNLAYWIQHPQEVHHGTAMPDMQVSQADAEIITQYLESLH